VGMLFFQATDKVEVYLDAEEEGGKNELQAYLPINGHVAC